VPNSPTLTNTHPSNTHIRTQPNNPPRNQNDNNNNKKPPHNNKHTKQHKALPHSTHTFTHTQSYWEYIHSLSLSSIALHVTTAAVRHAALPTQRHHQSTNIVRHTRQTAIK
jgi:hypothetical protein